MMRNFFKHFVFCALIFSAMGLSSQTNPYLNDNRVLMTVGNTPVVVSEFMNVYLKNNQGDEILDKKTIDEYIQMYAEFKAKVLEAETQKLDTAAAFHKELEGYRKDLAKPYFVDEVVIDQLVSEAYQRMQEDIRASHILIFCNEEAAPKDTLAAYKKIESARKRILKGEDFSVVAMEVSDDPSAKDQPAKDNRPAMKGNKGDLGYFTVFNMVYPFETAAYNTPYHSVSPIVRTSFGYHLIKVTDRQPAMGSAQVSHIFFQSRPSYTEAQNDSLARLASDVYTKLKNGGQWETLVRQYSDDKATAQYNGLLPWFTCNRMVADFIVAVRQLKEKGDISAPVKTSYGYHIIRLEGTKPIPSFDEAKADIRNKVLRDSRSELSTEAIVKKIKKEYTYTPFPQNLKKFQDACDPSLLTHNWNSESVSNLSLPLLIIGDSTLITNDFISYIKIQQGGKNPEENPTASTETIETMTAKYFKLWSDKTCLAYEDHRLEKKYPAFRVTLNEYHDGILLYEMVEKEVWGRSTRDTIGLETYFNQNRNQYMWGERRDFTKLATTAFTSEKTAESAKKELLKMLNKGKSDDEIQSIIHKKDTSVTVKIIHEKTEKDADPDVTALWDSPIPYAFAKVTTDNAVEIIRINKTVAPEPKKLNETRGLAVIDYQDYLEQTWLQKLRSQYPVKVNQNVLDSLKKQF